MLNEEFRECMIELDIYLARKLWNHTFPHLVQPTTDQQMLVMLHHARTQTQSISLRLRAYSHRWLCDNGYPSGLPDELKPKAEQIFPKVVEAVGISVNVRSPEMQPVADAMHGAMVESVMNSFEDGVKDPKIVKDNMLLAKVKAFRKMIG